MTSSNNSSFPALSIDAPTKINLYLHVTGKRADGYHLLDSYTVFARNLSDQMTFSAADGFDMTVSGPYADSVPEDNLVTRAVDMIMPHRPHLRIHLEKNIPAGAGLGGGSSDAAATVKALEKIYDRSPEIKDLLKLGADVPACYHQKPCRFSGIGEIIEDAPPPPPCHALIIWPNCHSATKDVFIANKNYSPQTPALPVCFKDFGDFIAFLQTTQNDLEDAAISINPSIQGAKDMLHGQSGCALARMSGSGSAVFGLFEKQHHAHEVMLEIQKSVPTGYFVQTTSL